MNTRRWSDEELKEAKTSMERDGYVVLRNFVPTFAIERFSRTIETLRSEIKVTGHRPNAIVSRAIQTKYASFAVSHAGSPVESIFSEQIVQNETLAETLATIAGRELFQTNAQSFEIEPREQSGLRWHVGYYSFAYALAEAYCCTLWIPLQPIQPAQRGGMQYISRSHLSGSFVYPMARWYYERLKDIPPGAAYLEEALSEAYLPNSLDSLIETGVPAKYIAEDYFQPGDALLFHKDVLHRSAAFLPGELQSRTAVVCRFVERKAALNREGMMVMGAHIGKQFESRRMLGEGPPSPPKYPDFSLAVLQELSHNREAQHIPELRLFGSLPRFTGPPRKLG